MNHYLLNNIVSPFVQQIYYDWSILGVSVICISDITLIWHDNRGFFPALLTKFDPPL